MMKIVLKFMIELKRRTMYRKAREYGLNSPEVVHCSQELDELLNKYSKKVA